MTDTHWGHEHPSPEAVRSSALALLASGNSIESVAHVLGVAVDTLQSWAAQPAVAASMPAPAEVTSERIRPWLSFPTTTIYALGPLAKYLMLAMVSFLAGVPLLVWILASVNGTGAWTFAFCALLAVPCLGLAACAYRYATRARFEMWPHSVARVVFSEPTVLQYSEIVGLTATRMGKSASYRVVLHARAGTPSLTIDPEDAHLRDPNLLAWLNSIPRQDSDPIRFTGDEAAPSGWLRLGNAFLYVLILLAMLGFARWTIGLARAAFDGYPPLQQLSVTEGTLIQVGNCFTTGRGYRYVTLTMQTDSGWHQETLDCIVYRRILARPGPHHVAIYRDSRHFADGEVVQVEIDGQVLQSYADVVARGRRTAPFLLVWQLTMLATVASLGYGFFKSNQRSD